jgi:hypothetical protein
MLLKLYCSIVFWYSSAIDLKFGLGIEEHPLIKIRIVVAAISLLLNRLII